MIHETITITENIAFFILLIHLINPSYPEVTSVQGESEEETRC